MKLTIEYIVIKELLRLTAAFALFLALFIALDYLSPNTKAAPPVEEICYQKLAQCLME